MSRYHLHIRKLRPASVVVALVALGTGVLAFAGSSSADVSAVTGSAYGYSTSVGLFGGPPGAIGPVPTVSLPAGGSAAPITGSAATGRAAYGPGIIFTSGPITVSTQGTPGPTGSVTSSTSFTNVNTSLAEVFTAATLASRCTASETGVAGSTTIAGGVLQTDDGSTAVPPIPDHPAATVNLPANPAPNTSYDGHLHAVGDTFRYVFNEQITNPDGSLTVNAAHQYLLGPTAVGDAIIGHVVCGVTAAAATTTSTTVPTTTTSTTVPTTTTSTTVPATTTTSTTVPATTTTTTVPAGPTCFGRPATIIGTPGADRLRGTNAPDVIVGLGGKDRISGRGGDDVICAGDGNDEVSGGSGNDRIDGGAGNDGLTGDSGDDTILGGDGRDRLVGGPGRNLLDGGPGRDRCRGNARRDTFTNCETRR